MLPSHRPHCSRDGRHAVAGAVARWARWAVPLLIALSTISVIAQPARLSQTGLWQAPGQLADGVHAFAPQHALWSDGASKRRWIRLPRGSRIDARQVDAWRFPVGTELWKEFGHGSAVETRYMRLLPGGRWVFASYRWRADGSDADLVPAAGQARAPLAGAPGGRYDFPSHADCIACHGGARSPVLGFAALQLGPSLPAYMRAGLLRNAPERWLREPPSMPGRSELERAARGYLHANCAHCHHESGVPNPLRLAQNVAAPPGGALPAAEILRRVATRNPYLQMPPLATRQLDPEGLALLRAWLLPPTTQESP